MTKGQPPRGHVILAFISGRECGSVHVCLRVEGVCGQEGDILSAFLTNILFSYFMLKLKEMEDIFLLTLWHEVS